MSRTVAIVYNAMQSVWWRRELIGAMRVRGHRVVAIAPFDGFEDRVRGLGVTVHPIAMSRMGMGPAEQACVLWELVRLFRAERVDVALLTTIKPIVLGSIAARLTGVRDVSAAITGLGIAFDDATPAQRRRAGLARGLYRHLLPRMRKLIFQNPDDLAAFRVAGFARDDQIVLTAGSGVNLGDFTCAPPVTDPIHFVLIARMLRTKGVPEFVAAARALKARHGAKIAFTLVGPLDANLDAVMQAEMDSWTRDGTVTYAGAVDDVRPFLARASVYVLPSYYKEGIPRTSLEAMALGRPVITTDLPGCRETVRPGENGFFVPPRDAGALADAMERFVAEPDLIARMGAASRALAEARFDQARVNAQIIDALGL